MKELKNAWHTELAIGILINDEVELEAKLDLLTSIGITTSNDETFKLCEKIRESLVSESDQEVAKTEGQELRENVSSGVEIESISRSHGLSKFSDFYGEE